MPVTNIFTKHPFFNFFLIVLTSCSFLSFAQTNDATFNVSFPTNRIVFQRNNENFGFINIMGNYTQSLDKIEAKLTPIAVGQGVATGEYSVALKDLQGNKYLSPKINTNLIYPKGKPAIANDIDLEFCTDGTKK